MDPPISPQPPSSGLFHAHLKTSWRACSPGSPTQTEKPKSNPASSYLPSDMTYLDDPPAPREAKPAKKKKPDRLAKILEDVGFEEPSEAEAAPDGDADLDGLSPPQHRSSSIAIKYGKRKTHDASTPDQTFNASESHQTKRRKQQTAQDSVENLLPRSSLQKSQATYGPKIDCQYLREIIDISSDEGVVDEHPSVPAKQGVSDTSSRPINAYASHQANGHTVPNLRPHPAKDLGNAFRVLSQQEYNHGIPTTSKNESRLGLFAPTSSTESGQSTGRSSSMQTKGPSKVYTYEGIQMTSTEKEHVPDTSLPFPKDEAKYSAESGLGSLFSGLSEINSPRDIEGDFRAPTGLRQPASEPLSEEVEQDSLPVLLRRIVSTLHRPLRSREEVVDDIANNYRESALRLIQNLKSRHDFEAAEASKAHEKAAQEILIAFVTAERDLEKIIEEVKGIDVGQIATSVRRPKSFMEKLNLICRLYAEKLHKFEQVNPEKGLAELGVDSEDEQDEALISHFQDMLYQKVKHPDPARERNIEKLFSKVERIYGKPQQPGGEKLKKAENTIFDDMERAFDTMISKLQESPEGNNDVLGGALRWDDEKSAGSIQSGSSDQDEDEDFE